MTSTFTEAEHFAHMMSPEKIAELMRKMAMTPAERYDNDFQRLHPETEFTVDMAEKTIFEFFQKHSVDNRSFPAVDIASGRATGTIQLALGFRKPFFEAGELSFYPTEYEGDGAGIDETKKYLQYHIDCDSKTSEVLFEDKEKQPCFRDDLIELYGLNAKQYNWARGILKGPDPKTPGRYGVQLSPDPKDQKSFKPDNIRFPGCPRKVDFSMRLLRMQGQSLAFFTNLFNNIRLIDIFKRDTWQNVDDLMGECAMVTCMNFMSCLGYREPTAWQDTMELASKLLKEDGCFVQFDSLGHGGFGSKDIMKAYCTERKLNFEHVDSKFAPWSNGEFICIVWKKVAATDS